MYGKLTDNSLDTKVDEVLLELADKGTLSREYISVIEADNDLYVKLLRYGLLVEKTVREGIEAFANTELLADLKVFGSGNLLDALDVLVNLMDYLESKSEVSDDDCFSFIRFVLGKELSGSLYWSVVKYYCHRNCIQVLDNAKEKGMLFKLAF